MTSNYNSEDFIIQALSSLVLPPGGSRWAELNFRLKISSSIFIQINVSTFKVLFDAGFTHSLQFKTLTYFRFQEFFSNYFLQIKTWNSSSLKDIDVNVGTMYGFSRCSLTSQVQCTGKMYLYNLQVKCTTNDTSFVDISHQFFENRVLTTVVISSVINPSEMTF